MGEARAEVVIDRPANEVWAMVGDFTDVTWMPGVEGCRLIDEDERVLSLSGADFTERLLRRDDDRRSLTYSVVAGPLPLDHHEATITVTAAGASRG